MNQQEEHNNVWKLYLTILGIIVSCIILAVIIWITREEYFLNYVIQHKGVWGIVIYSAWEFLEGYREGDYWYLKNKLNEPYRREHTVFNFQRTLVFIFLCYVLSYGAIFLVMQFPFLHDGAYYLRRNQLDKNTYDKNTWFAQSTTSNALSDKLNLFTPVNRTILFGLGLIGYIGYLLYNYML